jgi:FkbM family methyltransferase
LKPETNHFFYSYEWSYKNIQAKITCEKYLENNDGELLDYKFFCFNSEVKYIQVDVDRFVNHTRCFYDLEWEKQPFTYAYPLYAEKIPRPINFSEMVSAAEKLSKAFPFVRVDFYEVENKIYFGELTFYPENGTQPFDPTDWDYTLGDLLQLPIPSFYQSLVNALIDKERHYGGIITNVPRNKVSIYDPRTKEEILSGGMTGGDRMSSHDYAWEYAEYLAPFVQKNKQITLIEIGILYGTGLAIWSDIFADGHIIGLDIDLSHINANMDNLKMLGAFKNNPPYIYEFDQFVDNTEYLGRLLGGKKIDICIDDGIHSAEAIMCTMKSMIPHLSESFVYFIEDNSYIHKTVEETYPDFSVYAYGELTVVCRRKENRDALTSVTPRDDTFTMFVPPRCISLYENGYEILTTRITKMHLASKDIFIDVGAKYGYYSLLAASANKDIKIIAVEPIEGKFKVLNNNFIHNNIDTERAKCINADVSASSGKIKFYKSEASDNSSVLPHPNAGTLEQLEVSSVSLDDLLKKEQYKSLFIKIDTEGHEMEVLKGLSSTFNICGDITILLEMNPKMLRIDGTSSGEIIALLHDKGFSMFAIDDKEARFYPMDKAVNVAMMESMYEKSYYNVLCIKKTKALSVLFFSHAASLTGAERSLLDLIRGLSERGVLCTAVLPSQGPLRDALMKLGCAVYLPSDGTFQVIGWWWANSTPGSSMAALSSASEVAMDVIIPGRSGGFRPKSSFPRLSCHHGALCVQRHWKYLTPSQHGNTVNSTTTWHLHSGSNRAWPPCTKPAMQCSVLQPM